MMKIMGSYFFVVTFVFRQHYFSSPLSALQNHHHMHTLCHHYYYENKTSSQGRLVLGFSNIHPLSLTPNLSAPEKSIESPNVLNSIIHSYHQWFWRSVTLITKTNYCCLVTKFYFIFWVSLELKERTLNGNSFHHLDLECRLAEIFDSENWCLL